MTTKAKTETTETTTETEYLVLDKSAQMPGTCWGRYRKLALCEVVAGTVPAMISERARGMVRIVDVRDRLHAGSCSDRTAYGRALAELEAEADRLNCEKWGNL